MRTNLELWLIVEQNFDELFYVGLCSLLFFLIGKDIINKSEYDILKKIINEYKDNRFYFRKDEDFYFWEKGHEKPRRMFIQKQILKELRNEK